MRDLVRRLGILQGDAKRRGGNMRKPSFLKTSPKRHTRKHANLNSYGLRSHHLAFLSNAATIGPGCALHFLMPVGFSDPKIQCVTSSSHALPSNHRPSLYIFPSLFLLPTFSTTRAILTICTSLSQVTPLSSIPCGSDRSRKSLRSQSLDRRATPLQATGPPPWFNSAPSNRLISPSHNQDLS